MKYKIISDSRPESLEKKVQELLDGGWQPLGGPTVNVVHHADKYGPFDRDVYTLTQALIHYDDSDKIGETLRNIANGRF